MPSRPLTAALRETLAVFDESPAPLTTTEVADRLDLGRRSVYERLDRLVDHGELETKKAGANARVWWRPAAAAGSDRDADADQPDALAEYARIVETVGDGIYVLDEAGAFRRVNDAFVSMTPFDRDELVGSHASTVFGATFDGVDEEAREAFEAGETDVAAFETEIESGDGDRVVESRFTQFEVEGGHGRLGVVRDVTDRKERERALELYETIVSTVEDGVYVMDEEFRFSFVNEAYCELTGYDRDDLLGAHSTLVVDDEVSSASERLLGDLGEDETSALLEADVHRADGSRVRAESKFTGLPADGPDGLWKLGVVRDVSERVERERELEQYRRIIETMDDGVYVVDEDGEFTLVNEAYCELTGYDRDELVGSPVTLVIDDETAGQALDLEGDLVSGDRSSARLEADVETASGESIPAEATFTLLERDEGDYRVGVVRDVSERVERERQLRSQRERLAALNHLHGVVRSVTTAVIEQSTRAEIEQDVCAQLAASDSYAFAWVGEADTATESIRPRAEAGADAYLEEIELSLDPDDNHGQGPAARALRTREVQVVDDAFEDGTFEPWREPASELGVRSVIAIPVVHDDVAYGVLCVYAERPGAFTGEEREVIEQLGDIVGHAIAGVERKRALTSDQVTEVELRIEDALADLDATTGGTISIDQSVPVGGDEYLVYGTATADAASSLAAVADAMPHLHDLRTFDDEVGAASFEARFVDPPVLSVLAAHGSTVEEARLDGGDYELTVQLPPGADVRALIDDVQAVYAEASVLAQRQVTRAEGEGRRLRRALTEDLTERQRTALDAAYYAGFFDWPRESTAEDLADSLDISPPTFHQHMRKAERKLLTALYEDPSPDGA